MSQLSPSNFKRISMSLTVPPAIAVDVQILPGWQNSYTSPANQGILFRIRVDWNDAAVHPMARHSLPLVLANGGDCGAISRQSGAIKYQTVFLLRISCWLSWSLTKKAWRAPLIFHKTSLNVAGIWWISSHLVSVYKQRKSCLQNNPWIDNWTSRW